MLKNLRIISVFVLILQILISSCVKVDNLLLTQTTTNTAFSYSTKSNNINYYPSQNKEYFESKDFKLIINLIESLDTSKINTINNENTSLNNEISSLLSSVSSSLSSLNTQKQSLANHINAITKKQYITYDIADKPDSIGSYFDKAYFLDLDLRNLLSDGVSLYAPDKDDVDQDNLKESWEVSQDRVEVLDPSDLFDSIKAYSDEIQTAKDLISDYQNNIFLSEDKLEAIQTLDSLVRNIKEHKALLLARAKKFNKDYEQNFNDIKESEVELHQSLILPLALAMEQSGDFDDNTYLHKASSMTTQGLRTLDVKDWYDWAKTKYEVAKTFTSADLSKKEKVLAIMLGYSKDEWLQFKSIDPQGATELINATAELVEAVGIPTTSTGAVLTFAGPISKLFGKLSKVSTSLLSKKLAPSQAVYIKKLKDGIASVKATMNKWFGKYFPKGCLDSIMTTQSLHTQGFSIQAINICPFAFLEKLKFPQTRKGFFHIINQPEIIQKASQEITKKLLGEKKLLQRIPNYPIDVLNKIDNFVINGIKRKAKTGFPDFTPYIVSHNGNKLEFVITNMTGTTGDFYKACNRDEIINFVKDLGFLSQDFINSHTRSDVVKKAQDIISQKLQLTWHHNEDLKTMQLVPRVIHDKISHLGAASIIRSLENTSRKYYYKWIGLN